VNRGTFKAKKIVLMGTRQLFSRLILFPLLFIQDAAQRLTIITRGQALPSVARDETNSGRLLNVEGLGDLGSHLAQGRTSGGYPDNAAFGVAKPNS
jgi:hypothetical protein